MVRDPQIAQVLTTPMTSPSDIAHALIQFRETTIAQNFITQGVTH